jgi:putative endonuclease
MFFVYILRCADTTLYTGITNDVAKRLHHHNTTKTGAKYTSGRRPVELVYTETYTTKGEALSREADIKKLSRDAKLTLITAPHSTENHSTF